MTPQHEQDIAQDERDATASDRTAGQEGEGPQSSPPGNPVTDEEAVEKGEEQIGRVVGR